MEEVPPAWRTGVISANGVSGQILDWRWSRRNGLRHFDSFSFVPSGWQLVEIA